MVRISVNGPWSFKLAREHLLRSSLGVECSLWQGRLRRVLRLGREYFLVEFSSPDHRILHLLIHGEPSGRQIEEAVAITRRLFGLDQPIRDIYSKMSAVNQLDIIRRKFSGLRIFQTTSLFEMAATAIIGQQVNLRFTREVKRRFISLCGRHVTVGGLHYVGFPSPERVRHMTIENLRAIQFSRRKAEYLIDFARAVDDGEVHEPELQRASDEEIRARLMQYRGIGKWTADMILMRALGRLDILPSLDTGLQTAYGLAFKRPRPTSDELLELTAGWTGFRSYATFYLWAYLGSKSPSLSRVSDESLYS